MAQVGVKILALTLKVVAVAHYASPTARGGVTSFRGQRAAPHLAHNWVMPRRFCDFTAVPCEGGK